MYYGSPWHNLYFVSYSMDVKLEIQVSLTFLVIQLEETFLTNSAIFRVFDVEIKTTFDFNFDL